MKHLDHPSPQWCQNGAFLLLRAFIIAFFWGGRRWGIIVIVPLYFVQDCTACETNPHTIRPITPSSAVYRYCSLPIVMARNSSTSVIFQPRERHMRSLPTCGGDFCSVTFESQKQVFDCFSQWLVLCFLHSSFISSSAAIMEEQTITSPSRYMLVSQGFQASESSTMWLPLRAWNRRQSWHMARVRTH